MDSDLKHGDRQNSYVLVDVDYVVRFVGIRPIDEEHVEELVTLLKDYGYDYSFPLKGYFLPKDNVAPNSTNPPPKGEVALNDGAHRTIAVRWAKMRGHLPKDLLVPMVVSPQPQDNLPPVLSKLLALPTNEEGQQTQSTAPIDKLLILSNLRDTMLSLCPREEWKDKLIELRNWAMETVKDNPVAIQTLMATLSKEYMYAFFSTVRSLRRFDLRSHHQGQDPSEIKLHDERPWQTLLLCTNRDSTLVNERYPALPNKKCTGLNSPVRITRGIATCQFLRGKFSKSSSSRWAVSDSTPFQQLLFLTSLTRLSEHYASGQNKSNQAKMAGKSRVQEPNIPPLKSRSSFTSETKANRIGYAIYMVVQAWDKLARSVGSTSIEDMTAPYLFFDHKSATFFPILSRRNGYAPASQRLSLVSQTEGPIPVYEPTRDETPEETGEDAPVDRTALDRSDVQDTQLRFVTKSFLHDIARISGIVATSNEEEAWNAVCTKYATPPSSPPIPAGSGSTVHLPLGVRDIARSLTALHQAVERLPVSLPVPEEPSPEIYIPARRKKRRIPGQVHNGESLHEDVYTGEDPPEPKRQRTNSPSPAPKTRSTSAPAPTELSANSPVQEEETTEPAELQVPGIAQSSPIPSPCKLRDMYPNLCHALSKRAVLLCCRFEDFRETLEEPWFGLEGKVQFLAWDPPFNIRRDKNLPNSDHDTLSGDQMQIAASLVDQLLRPGGHALIKCAFAQHTKWLEVLSTFPDLVVDSSPLFFIRARNHPGSAPNHLTTTFKNMVEVGVHATKKGAGRSALTMVNYTPQGFLASTYPGHTNVFTNVTAPKAGESLLIPGSGGALIRPEQTSVLTLQEWIGRFSKPQDIVVDLFAGTYSSADACLSMPEGQFRHFYGCEPDPVCHNAGYIRVLRTFAWQVHLGFFSADATVLVKKEAEQFLETYPNRRTSPLAKKIQPSDLPKFSRLPRHLLLFLVSRFKSEDPLKILHAKPPTEWPAEWQQRWFSLDEDDLLAVDALHFKVYVKPSSIPDAGMGLFAAEDIPAKTTIGWYGGTLIYKDLTHDNRSGGTVCGPPGFDCSIKRFQMYALQFRTQHAETAWELREKQAFVVPRPFCAASYINDATYRGHPTTSCAPSQNNAKLLSHDLTSLEALTDPWAASVETTTDVARDQEIFVKYGAQYWK